MRYMVVVLLLSGCASMAGPNSMSADQLKQIAADKNASAVCSQVSGMWGTGRVVSVNIDKGSIANGDVTVDDKCTVTIHNTVPVKVAPVKP